MCILLFYQTILLLSLITNYVVIGLTPKLATLFMLFYFLIYFVAKRSKTQLYNHIIAAHL